MARTVFTRRAWSRVVGLLTLTPVEVVAILDYHLTIPVEADPAEGIVHRLFYSPPDDAHFVAIQSVRSGAVLAIVPWAPGS